MINMLSVAVTLFYALVTQVAAQTPNPKPVGGTFNVSLGAPPQTFLFNNLFGFSFSGPISQCSQNCSSVNATLAGTQGNATQLCQADTVKALLQCEQCMFEGLIAANKPMPDVRAGSTPLLQGYSAACTERADINLTKPEISLALPPTWDGPTGIFVPTFGLVFTVGTGAFLGLSSIVMLSNM